MKYERQNIDRLGRINLDCIGSVFSPIRSGRSSFVAFALRHDRPQLHIYRTTNCVLVAFRIYSPTVADCSLGGSTNLLVDQLGHQSELKIVGSDHKPLTSFHYLESACIIKRALPQTGVCLPCQL